MIGHTRPKKPDFFNSEEINNENKRLYAYYSQDSKLRDNIYFKPKYQLNSPILDLLMVAFFNKCAFCEMRLISKKPSAVERFRPSIKAMDLKGKISEEHYWWLRYDWTNLYLCCRECNKHKSNLFPIKRRRALPYTTGIDLQKEEPLLIDPCNDQPEKHFFYEFNSGLMISDTERGRLTIDIFGLNRQELLQQRKEEILQLKFTVSQLITKLKQHKNSNKYPIIVEYERLLLEIFKDQSQPFLLMKRQYIKHILMENIHLLNDLSFSDEWTKIMNTNQLPPVGKRQQESLINYNDYLIRGDSYDLNNKSELHLYFKKSVYIEKIEIKNFKTIKDLTIDIFPNNEGNAPWFLILGENSTGKSTILKAIALALMDRTSRNKISNLDARKFLYQRSKTGYVKVYLSGRKEPVELFFNNENAEFKRNIEDVPVLLMGYGSTRLLSSNTGLDTVVNSNGAIRCDNLFNPISSLVDAELWLSKLSVRKFKDAVQTIKRLFAIDENYRFIRRLNKTTGKKEILVTLFGTKTTLHELSDGYQSILALACDIMMVLQEIWQDSEYAQGIVLLDELDVHLHPRWKMQIVKKLKETFPRIQFIATSHEPLVLRSLTKDEIMVLRRDKHHRLSSIKNLPSPEALRVDQILTSPYFGLKSTIDPDIEKLFDRYYFLLSESFLTEDNRNELEQIQGELEEMKLLGETPRDQLMYKAIDQFLAKEKETIKHGEINSLKEETVHRITDILSSLDYIGE